MQLYVNSGDEIPIYRQIVRQITDAIAGGRLETGARLPSHRDLAEELVIAPLTVKKAYDELERAGLLVSQRGRGTFVAETLPALGPAEGLDRLRDPAKRLVSQAALLGVPFDDLLLLLEELRKDGKP